MKLSRRTLSRLAELVCGASGGSGFSWDNFPYRSSTYLTEFFRDCGLDFVHDGSTRKYWVLDVLEKVNEYPTSSAHLPSDATIRVIQELMAPDHFWEVDLDHERALDDINQVLARDGLEVAHESGACHVRSTGTGTSSSALVPMKRPLSAKERELRERMAEHLTSVSEDELIENILVPLFRRLGFERISVTGHKDKSLEFGKDLWMKYRLPTDHLIYFGAQVKIGKIDSAGRSDANVAEIHNQILMMIDHPIWDPENNRRHLLDHVFIISAGRITKQAKAWLGQRLDADKRRQILFMDRDELLELCAAHGIAPPPPPMNEFDDLPF